MADCYRKILQNDIGKINMEVNKKLIIEDNNRKDNNQSFDVFPLVSSSLSSILIATEGFFLF